MHTLLHVKQISNKDQLYSAGNPAHCSVIACMGEEPKERVDICICITGHFLYT